MGDEGKNIDKRAFPGKGELDERMINGRSPVEMRG
jgi:hypothetical protein